MNKEIVANLQPKVGKESDIESDSPDVYIASCSCSEQRRGEGVLQCSKTSIRCNTGVCTISREYVSQASISTTEHTSTENQISHSDTSGLSTTLRRTNLEPGGISGFLGRRVNISNDTWTSGAGLSLNLDVQSLFFSNSDVAEKIDHFSLMRYDINLEIVFSCMPFQAGILEGGVVFASDVSQITPSLATFVSTLPYGFIKYASHPDPITVKIPYMDSKEYVTPGDGFGKDLRYRIESIGNLLNTNGSTASIKLSTFMWLSNVEMFAPTSQAETGTAVESSSPGIVEGIASGISEAAEIAGEIFPPISWLASPISAVTGVVSSVAHLFGWTREYLAEAPTAVVQFASNDFNMSDTAEAIFKLAVDPQQALSRSINEISPTTIDQLAITNFTRRWGLIDSGLWTVASTPNTVLSTLGVTPIHSITSGNFTQHTACSYVSRLFSYGHFPMEYLICFGASSLQTGIARIVYDPDSTGTFTSTNLQHLKIAQVSGPTTIFFSVPWTRKTGFSEMSVDLDASVLTSTRQNGVISLVVQNSIISPDAAAGIPYAIFARAGPDMALMRPRNSFKSDTFYSQAETSEPVDFKTFMPPADVTLPAAKADAQYRNKLGEHYGGENVFSIRTLLSRYHLYLHDEINIGTTSTSTVEMNFKLPIRLNPRGGSVADNMQYFHLAPTAGTKTNYVNLDLSVYMRQCFYGMRGGRRWKMRLDHYQGVGVGRINIRSTRADTDSELLPNINLHTTLRDDFLHDSRHSAEQHGSADTMLEWEQPDYLHELFHTVPQYESSIGSGERAASIECTATTVHYYPSSGSSSANGLIMRTLYTAMAPDMQFIGYNGIPTLTSATRVD